MKCNVSDKLYIDRTAAIMTAINYDGNGNAQDASQDIASALSALPAADVVEVVRCKDCVFLDDNEARCKINKLYIENANWFCADGRAVLAKEG